MYNDFDAGTFEAETNMDDDISLDSEEDDDDWDKEREWNKLLSMHLTRKMI